MASLTVWISIICAGLFLLYKYLTKNFSRWDSTGIKTRKPWPIISIFYKMFVSKKPGYEYDIEFYKHHGIKTWGEFEMGYSILVSGDLEIIKTVMVKEFGCFTDRMHIELPDKDPIIKEFISMLRGNEWRAARNILSPTFTSGKMKKMDTFMEECSRRLTKQLEQNSPEEGIEIKKFFQSFTLDVIANTNFGIMINAYDKKDPFVDASFDLAGQNLRPGAIFAIMFPKLAGLFGITVLKKDSLDYLKRLLDGVIESRRKGTKRNDFLQLLLDAQKENKTGAKATEEEENDGDRISHFNLNVENLQSETGTAKELTDTAIQAHAMLFFLAGFDTISLTLTYSSYCLALNPDSQDKLRQEIDDHFNTKDSITYDEIVNMEYLDCVISETLRMYPAVTRLDRVCTKSCKLGNIQVNPEDSVQVPVYAIHYDENYYTNPNKFDPDRFNKENKNHLVPYTYLPFGVGPRNCVGMRFALLETKFALVYLIRNFTIETCEKTEIPISWVPGIPGLKAKKEVVLKLVKRK